MPYLNATPFDPTANSYADVPTAVDYLTNQRAYASAFTGLADDVTRGTFLIWATRTLDACFDYPGTVTTLTQSLRWPRIGVRDADGRYVDQNVIPLPVMQACATMALELCKTDRSIVPPITQMGFSQANLGPMGITIDSKLVIPLIPESVIDVLREYGWPKAGLGPSAGMVVKLRRG